MGVGRLATLQLDYVRVLQVEGQPVVGILSYREAKSLYRYPGVGYSDLTGIKD